MKTKSEKKTKSELKNRPEPLSTTTANSRGIDFRRRTANRSLTTAKLLALLESETPKFFEMAEVVGHWVWIQFEDKQPAQVTRILAELGFHWNRVRQAWQHPCGRYLDRPSPIDPRQKYRSYFPADRKPC